MTQTHLFMRRSAVFSDCGLYRYVLWRRWDDALPYANFICLNPSQADAERDDHTSVRCVDYTLRWKGYGATCITNAYAFATSDPKKMKRASDPVGPDNDRWLQEIAAAAGLRVAAWGTHATFMERDKAVRQLITQPLHYLTLTRDGHPHHPLRLSAALTPSLWTPQHVSSPP